MRTQSPPNPNRLFQQMIEATPSAQLSLRAIEADARKRAAAAAKADPKAHRATRVFDPGIEPDYRFLAVRPKSGAEVRFCWTVNRNAAGRFLIFRERVTAKGFVKRDRFEAILDKRAAILSCKLYRNEVEAQRSKAAAKRAAKGQG